VSNPENQKSIRVRSGDWTRDAAGYLVTKRHGAHFRIARTWAGRWTYIRVRNGVEHSAVTSGGRSAWWKTESAAQLACEKYIANHGGLDD
jgi:hypothetical protein